MVLLLFSAAVTVVIYACMDGDTSLIATLMSLQLALAQMMEVLYALSEWLLLQHQQLAAGGHNGVPVPE